MIPEDYFIRQIKKASDLNGHLTKRETALEIYNRLKYFDDRDFSAAIEDLIEEGERITYISLKRRLNARRYTRENQEARQRAELEAREIKELTVQGREYKCSRNKRCYECPVQNCRIVGKAAIKGLIAIGSGIKSKDQVNTELAEEFPGAGFDNF